MTQAWDFVGADILWQRSALYLSDSPILRRRIDEIEWPVGSRVRFIHVCKNFLVLGRDYEYTYQPIVTIRDLIDQTETELLRQPNLGRTSVERIKTFLAQHGLSLRKG